MSVIDMTSRPQPLNASRSVEEDRDSYEHSPSMETGEAEKVEHQEKSYHRDLYRRPFTNKPSKDKFLNPYDGRLCDLVVQSSKEILESNSAQWSRKGLQNGSPWMIRLSNWAMSRDHESEETVGIHTQETILRWIPACLALAMVVSSAHNYVRGDTADVSVSDQSSHSSGRHVFSLGEIRPFSLQGLEISTWRAKQIRK